MSGNQVIKKTPLTPTVLISNGISFLGLNLCRALLDEGARVVVLDKVTDEVSSRAKKLLGNPNFALFNADPEKGVPEKIQSVDYIYALSYDDDPLDKEQELVAEAFGMKSLLDLAVSSEAKFALVEPLFHKENVSKNPAIKNTEVYSSKENSSFLRSLIWDYVENKNLNGRIIRLCQVYGPGMSLESPIGLIRFIDSLINHKNLKVYGEGTSKAYYLHVADAIDGIIKALFYKRTSGRIFKLLSEDSHADLELVFILKSLADTELNLDYIEESRNELVFNTTLGETVPRWEQEKSLKEGIEETLNGFGYDINRHSFKPAKVIEQKIKEESLPQAQAIHSLLDLKKNSMEASSSNEKEKKKSRKKSFTLSLPDISFPKISQASKSLSSKTSGFSLPSISLAKLPKSAIFDFQLSSRAMKLAYVFIPVLVFLLFSVGAPLALTIYYARQASSSLEEVSLNMSQLQTSKSEIAAKKAFEDFYKSQGSFKRLRWIFTALGKEDTYNSTNDLLESATYFTGALYRTSKALDPFSTIWNVIRPDSPDIFEPEDFELSSQELSYARNTLDHSLASYKKVDKEALPKVLHSTVSEYSEILGVLDTSLNDALLLTGALPDVIGVEGEKEYLLLFQNSNEIRPTGGFIGSYATLTLRDGKIAELYIDDIYNPDGQIDARGIVSEVPAPLAQFLNEEYLYIRNANWDPDFPSSVRRVEDLFFKLEDRQFDGVIALDLELIKSMLEVTGPIFLAAYNEEVNSENLYERTQYHSEFDYQEGISDKRSFLSVLASKLLEQIFSLPPEKIPEFSSQINSSLEEKHLLALVNNSTLRAFLNNKNWDGSMVTPKKDYLMVVNANLGGTKANYFVENSYDYTVSSDTRDGLLRAELNLNYTHTGQDNAWPGGPYTNYLRVYVPKGSQLAGAVQNFNSGLPENILEDTISYPDGEYTVFATSFVLDPQENLGLTFNYDLPESISLGKEDKEYALYWQKQPGTTGDIFRFSFRGPFATEILTYAPTDMFREKNMAALEGYLEKDQEIELVMK